jgi:hypothetical protein
VRRPAASPARAGRGTLAFVDETPPAGSLSVPVLSFPLGEGEDTKLPLVFASEREAIAALLTTIRPCAEADLRLVWIRDTMRLERFMVSGGCLGALSAARELEVDPKERLLRFDGDGFLVPVFG